MKQKIAYIICIAICAMFVSCSKKEKENNPAVLTAKGKTASCISFASIPNGNFALSWAEKENDTAVPNFFFANWDNEKDTFGVPTKIPLERNTSFNEENKPFMVFQTKDSVWVIYSVSVPTPVNKYAGFVHYRISADGGKTWSQPHSLMNDTVPGESRSFANAIRLPNGVLAFAWMGGMMDMKIHGRALYYATTDGSLGFSQPVLIDSFACPCCRSSLAVSENGKVGIAYRSVRKDNIRDIAIVFKESSSNNFSKPFVFSNDQWQLDACPEDGPSLVVSDNKSWVGWFTGGANKGIYYATLDDKGIVLKKQQVEKDSRYIQLARMSNGKNAVIYNSTMTMNGMKSSMIELSKTEESILPSQELDTASYFATNPILISEGASGKLFTAWIAEGRVWYKEVE